MTFRIMSDADPNPVKGVDFGILVLRIALVAGLFGYQLWDHLLHAWGHVWNRSPWDLVDQLEKLSIPYPGPVASAFMLLVTVAALGVFLGIFTRFCSASLIVFLSFVLIALLELSVTLNPQALVLYLSICLCLVLGGGGRFSLDYLLAYRKPKPPPGY